MISLANAYDNVHAMPRRSLTEDFGDGSRYHHRVLSELLGHLESYPAGGSMEVVPHGMRGDKPFWKHDQPCPPTRSFINESDRLLK